MVRERRARGSRADVLVVLVGAALALAAAEALGQYELIDLGSLDGGNVYPLALNDREEVAGFELTFTQNGQPAYRAFAWRSGGIEELLRDVEQGDYRALDISFVGDVVGFHTSPDGQNRALKWTGQLAIELQFPFAVCTRAAAINDNGLVAGFASYENCSQGLAAYWYGDIVGTFGGNASIEDISTSGFGTGTSAVPRAVRYDFDSGSGPVDLETPTPWGSRARSVNEHGDVVGFFDVSGTGDQRPCAWFDGGFAIELGSLGGDLGYAHGINDQRQIVGASATSDGFYTHAFLWQSGVMLDLNRYVPDGSDWELIEAFDINETGSIVGIGIRGGVGPARGFLLSALETPCREGSVDRGSGWQVLFLNGTEGDFHHRRVFVRAGEPCRLFIDRPLRVREPRAEWALWIYEGERFDCIDVSFRTRSGRTFTIGQANACLPISNTMGPDTCIPPLADVLGLGTPLGVTSKRLGPGAASRFFLSTMPMPPAPTEISVAFPPGTFSIYSVHEDARSESSPEANLSLGNTIVVEASP